MFERLLAPLLETLLPHFDLSKTRLETLAVLLFGLANCRTVNLSHLASQFPCDARHASNYRRLQRFFQHIRLDGEIGAQLIVGMLKLGLGHGFVRQFRALFPEGTGVDHV